MKMESDEIISVLREEIAGFDNRTLRSETGTILDVGDGIATVYGLNNAVYGELVEFETGVRGMPVSSVVKLIVAAVSLVRFTLPLESRGGMVST